MGAPSRWNGSTTVGFQEGREGALETGPGNPGEPGGLLSLTDMIGFELHEVDLG
jgi:hypothetical protein